MARPRGIDKLRRQRDNREYPRITAEDRMKADFSSLAKRAGELAESWTNGNKTDVLEAIETSESVELGLLVAHLLQRSRLLDPAWHLARALHERGWEG